MSSKFRAPATVALAATFLVLSTQPASAAFGQASAEVWSQRSQRIAAAVAQPVAQGANLDESEAIGNAYFSGIKQSCTGITGELIKYGGKNMPVWAQTAQQSFCLGADNLARAYRAGKKDKDYCGNLRTAVGNARKAKRGEDPDVVVDAAQALIGASEELMNSKITFEKKSLLGSSFISFKC